MIVRLCGSALYLYCQNNNYNVVALTDKDGVVVEKVKYDPYGMPTCIRTSDSHEQTASHYGNPYLFQGRRSCSETNLYYFRNRYMSPTLGRFMQRDPIGYADGMNLYETATGRPTRVLDSYGLRVTVTIKHWAEISITGAGGHPLAWEVMERRIELQMLVHEAPAIGWTTTRNRRKPTWTIINVKYWKLPPQLDDGRIVCPVIAYGDLHYNVEVVINLPRFTGFDTVSDEVLWFYARWYNMIREFELGHARIYKKWFGRDWLVVGEGRENTYQQSKVAAVWNLSENAAAKDAWIKTQHDAEHMRHEKLRPGKPPVPAELRKEKPEMTGKAW